ncbi:YegP family protein [Dyadobacter chenhuakuii]|uniref:YegP family protein n=1 Tax=Dyadobacter chenhuakuii TaxID=2909339 RepID=A0A9X1QHH3_9BACT|nr:YegP family protein [Dyadobacter chenhuakuii]MCF2501676.1 YegP family protein [Dyadobacter chenhuakuii]
MGKFIIRKRSHEEYGFTLVAGNGEVILTSEGYEQKSSYIIGITSVGANSHLLSRYEEKRAINGQHYFVLKDFNGLVIGTSEMYTTSADVNKGI